MKLFLVRHGETVDNVAGVYAGITDSALTNHGILQANRLGQHLAAQGVEIAHIFSSNLSRAFKTAEAIRLAQPKVADNTSPPKTVQLALLREQDFGSLERQSVSYRRRESKSSIKKSHSEIDRGNSVFIEAETREAMRERANKFVEEHLLPLLISVNEEQAIVVVAHGIILIHVWRCILWCFKPTAVSIAPDVLGADPGSSLEYLGAWSNTGYLELEIKHMPTHKSKPEAETIKESSNSQSAAETGKPALPVKSDLYPAEALPTLAVQTTPLSTDAVEPALPNMSLVIEAIDSVEHLSGLKKTQGGIGNSAHDDSQKKIESFFKKRKIG